MRGDVEIIKDLVIPGKIKSALCGLLIFCGLIIQGAPAAAATFEPGAFIECTGVIQRTSDGKTVDFKEVASAVSTSQVVLFGERHGIREHSRASACVLSAMANDDHSVALVMEMLRRDDQSAIDAWMKANPENAAGLGVKLEWWKRGWPAFDNWLPILDRTFSLRAELFGGDVDPKQALGLKGFHNPQIDKKLNSHRASVEKSWQQAMQAAHCGTLNATQAKELAKEQIMSRINAFETKQS